VLHIRNRYALLTYTYIYLHMLIYRTVLEHLHIRNWCTLLTYTYIYLHIPIYTCIYATGTRYLRIYLYTYILIYRRNLYILVLHTYIYLYILGICHELGAHECHVQEDFRKQLRALQRRRRLRGGTQFVRNLLALLVQKYKYWRRKRCQGLSHPDGTVRADVYLHAIFLLY
jgi:hypothetical protein